MPIFLKNYIDNSDDKVNKYTKNELRRYSVFMVTPAAMETGD
jgi:hypothetical protein